MKTELRERLSSLEAEVAKLKADIEVEEREPQMPWFYPEVEEVFWTIDSYTNGNGYGFNIYRRLIKEIHPYHCPVIRTEEQAKIIAQARGDADRWRAMGVMPKAGEIRWFVDEHDFFGHCRIVENQRHADALFLTEDDAEKALKEFGGIEQLHKMRRGLWGDV